MRDLQPEAWFLHKVLQVFHSLSCNVRIKGRLSHGGKILKSAVHVNGIFFTTYSQSVHQIIIKKKGISVSV